MNGAFTQARQLAASTEHHKIVYLVLTDGHIGDFKETEKQCEDIRKDVKIGVEKPMLFGVGLGKGINE